MWKLIFLRIVVEMQGYVTFVLTPSIRYMTSTRLQDDLLKDFKDQKDMVYEQVKLLDPLATSLRKPAAQRLISKGALIFAEILCYLLAIGVIAFIFLMDKVYPFFVLTDIRHKTEYKGLGWMNIQGFSIVVWGMMVLIAFLFYLLGRSARAIRLKNTILNLAGKNIKEITGQHLKRKAVIDAIEQRHFSELPNEHLEEGVQVNDVPNPGYDGDEETPDRL